MKSQTLTVESLVIYTLYNVILRIARNFLEPKENIKSLTHPLYHINFTYFWVRYFHWN